MWFRVLGMVQETIQAKGVEEMPLEKKDAELLARLGIQGFTPIASWG